MSSSNQIQKKKRKKTITRLWVDLCTNDVTLDGFTVKERVAVSHSLGYSISTISNFFTLENMTKKDICDIPRTGISDDEDRQGIGRKSTLLGVLGSNTKQHLSRVTIQISSVENAHARLTELSPALKSYDIRAVYPTTEKAFQYACATMDVDIISLGKEAMSRRFNFPCRHDVMQKAVARGVVFEIPYSCFLTESSSKRQQFLSNARALVQGTGGTCIVCSSMASMGFEMRKPYDIVNMATFFGLSEEQAYDCVSTTPLKVIQKAQRRLAFKEKMIVEKLPKPVDGVGS